MEKKLHPSTLCVHAGYSPANGEPRQMPIIQSTTFKYTTSDEMGRLFDLEAAGYFYTRLQNPTNDRVAARLAALEGGVAGMLTSSGQAANFFACFNICEAGSHMITTSAIYGGTYNLFGVTFPKMGIEVTFIDQNASDEEIEAAFRPNTKLLFGETLTNPGVRVLDIERLAPSGCQRFQLGDDVFFRLRAEDFLDMQHGRLLSLVLMIAHCLSASRNDRARIPTTLVNI